MNIKKMLFSDQMMLHKGLSGPTSAVQIYLAAFFTTDFVSVFFEICRLYHKTIEWYLTFTKVFPPGWQGRYWYDLRKYA